MTRAMTLTKLAKAMAMGLGSGRGESYRSWIRVRRRHSSPVSNLHSLPVPTYIRALQLLSGLEFAAANVAIWLGVGELREQHPAWPDPHAHPASGMHPDFDRKLGMVPGLLEIAREAGIDHGVYPGTKIPFVATLDFTLGVGPWHQNRLVHWSCKPHSLLKSAPNRRRMRERIHMERLYSRAVGARHVLIDGTQFTPKLIENLDWLRPLRSELRAMQASKRLDDFAAFFMEISADASIEEAKLYAAFRTRMAKNDAEAHFRAAAWLGLIDLDLSQSVVMSRPMVRGRHLKERMQRKLLGAVV